jgi:hypothetical protein
MLAASDWLAVTSIPSSDMRKDASAAPAWLAGILSTTNLLQLSEKQKSL